MNPRTPRRWLLAEALCRGVLVLSCLPSSIRADDYPWLDKRQERWKWIGVEFTDELKIKRAYCCHSTTCNTFDTILNDRFKEKTAPLFRFTKTEPEANTDYESYTYTESPLSLRYDKEGLVAVARKGGPTYEISRYNGAEMRTGCDDLGPGSQSRPNIKILSERARKEDIPPSPLAEYSSFTRNKRCDYADFLRQYKWGDTYWKENQINKRFFAMELLLADATRLDPDIFLQGSTSEQQAQWRALYNQPLYVNEEPAHINARAKEIRLALRATIGAKQKRRPEYPQDHFVDWEVDFLVCLMERLEYFPQYAGFYGVDKEDKALKFRDRFYELLRQALKDNSVAGFVWAWREFIFTELEHYLKTAFDSKEQPVVGVVNHEAALQETKKRAKEALDGIFGRQADPVAGGSHVSGSGDADTLPKNMRMRTKKK